MSLGQQILGCDDLSREKVLVPEWAHNGAPLELWVRTMSGTERDRVEQLSLNERKDSTDGTQKNIRAMVVALSVVDDDGNRVFQDGDMEALGQKSSLALDRLWSVAQRLSGFSNQDVEELAKNSEAVSSGDSTSA